jgi:hypothetical protein
MRNLVVGVVLAGALALALSPVTIAGIDAWKIVLAAVGALVFVWSGRSGRPTSSL